MELSSSRRLFRRGLGLVVLVGGLGLARAETDLERTKVALSSLIELASIPSQSADDSGVRRAADWLVEQFRAAGLTSRLLDVGDGINRFVFAEYDPGGAAQTVLFYMHFDTQPTGPAKDWFSTGGQPFVPRLLSGRWDDPGTRPLDAGALDAETLKVARLYARGVADDKAPIIMHLEALRGWLQSRAARRLHIKYILDPEEEAGSPHIDKMLVRYSDLLRADLLVLCDGPMDALGRSSIYLGTRGDMHMKLSVSTAASSAHSGNYGLMPNAAWRLASLLASMKDAGGRVMVEGFEDDVLEPTAAQQEALEEASLAEPIIADHLGVTTFEGKPEIPYFERLLFHPGLVINYLESGRPGNQIPHTATALLEIRLVPDQDPRALFAAFQRHVERHLPEADLEYLDGIPARRMDARDPLVARGITAVRRASGGDLIIYPNLGGTLPLLETFTKAGYHYIGLPLVNFDNDQHVANENLRVRLLADGIGLLERFLDQLAAGD